MFAGTFLVAGVAGVTWVLWSNLGLALIHDDWAIRRFIGTTVLVLAAADAAPAPARVVVERRSRRARPRIRSATILFGPSLAAWGVVLVGVLSHPGSALVGYSGSGLPGGWPSFPGRPAVTSRPSKAEASGSSSGMPTRIRRQRPCASEPARPGSATPQTSQDGCGRLRVYVVEAP